MKRTCLIVDDEQLARKLLESYVSRLPQFEWKASCKSPLQAMQVLQEQHIDLMFLDIQMPDLLGTEMLRSLPKKPLVVFTTAYKEYALEGYELDVVDYLLKPISFPRFLQAVNKATRILDKEKIPTSADEKSSPGFLTVKADRKTYKLLHKDIFYIEGEREYVKYHCKDKRVMALESLKKLEESLSPHNFIRVHRSFIVNKSYVTSLSGNQLEINGTLIPVGKSYKEIVLKRIFS